MLRNLLRILAARKHTFVQPIPRQKAFAPLAQLAEQVTLNHWVAGSIPARCIFSGNIGPDDFDHNTPFAAAPAWRASVLQLIGGGV
jgi:hypothetical protein